MPPLKFTAEYLDVLINRTSDDFKDISRNTDILSQNSKKNSEYANLVIIALNELAKAAEHVAMNTERLNKTYKGNLIESNNSMEAMEDVGKNIENAHSFVVQIHNHMQELADSTRDIEKISELIRNTSKQTNLLALNASIEAARVGEFGRGFAVVASEIKKLAEESSMSAIKISDLTVFIQKNIADTANISQETEKWLNSLVGKNDTIRSQINNVIGNSSEILTSVEEIAALTQEQTATSQEVASMMQSLVSNIADADQSTKVISSKISEQTRALAKISGIAGELNNNSLSLSNITQQFSQNGQSPVNRNDGVINTSNAERTNGVSSDIPDYSDEVILEFR